MLQQASQHLLSDPHVLHEGQLADQVGDAVKAVQIGDDVGETVQKSRVGAVADLFVALLAGIQQELVKGVIAVLHGLFLGPDQAEHVIAVNQALDILLAQENAFQDLAGCGDIILLAC